MSAPVAVAACLCALSVFVATGLDRADARKIAGACKREAVLVAAAGRSVVDALTARVKGAVGAGGPARVSLGEVSEMIDVVRLGLSAGLSFDAALEVFCANRQSTLALRLERACMAWRVGVGTVPRLPRRWRPKVARFARPIAPRSSARLSVRRSSC